MGQLVSFQAARKSGFPPFQVGTWACVIVGQGEDMSILEGRLTAITDTTFSMKDEIDDFGRTRDVTFPLTAIETRLK